jgi:hypothetical protein
MDMFEMMDKALKFADILSKSDIIPLHYKGKPANCFIAVQSAYRMNIDPMLVMQNTYVVNAKLGWAAKFAIGLVNSKGPFDGVIRYKITGTAGKDLQCIAYAQEKGTGKIVESVPITWDMAVKENWVKNAKYQSMPDQMFIYRASGFLINAYCPEVLCGIPMAEELEDIAAANAKNVTPITSKAESLLKMFESEKTPEVVIEENKEVALEPVPYSSSELIALVEIKGVPAEITDKWLTHAGVNSLQELKAEDIQKCVAYINEKF